MFKAICLKQSRTQNNKMVDIYIPTLQVVLRCSNNYACQRQANAYNSMHFILP